MRDPLPKEFWREGREVVGGFGEENGEVTQGR